MSRRIFINAHANDARTPVVVYRACTARRAITALPPRRAITTLTTKCSARCIRSASRAGEPRRALGNMFMRPATDIPIFRGQRTTPQSLQRKLHVSFTPEITAHLCLQIYSERTFKFNPQYIHIHSGLNLQIYTSRFISQFHSYETRTISKFCQSAYLQLLM